MVAAALLVLLVQCHRQRADRCITALSHPDASVRRRASYELVTMGGSAVAPLLRAMETGSDSLQYIGVQILGRIADSRAAPTLSRLLKARNAAVREETALALGRLGTSAPASELAHVLAADTVAQVRAAAATGLANCCGTAIIPELCRALRDSAASVRRQTLVALDRIWVAAAADGVVRALADDDETVRFVAAQILGRHRVTQGRDGLCAALHDTSTWVRTEAARALGILGDSTLADTLVALMRRHDGPEHAAARAALRRLTGTDYVLLPQPVPTE